MKVLVLEDSKIVGEKISRTLKTHFERCQVVWEERALDVEVRLEAFCPDIVILDLHLPDGFGLDLVSMIRKKSPLSKICIFTNLDIPYMRQKALDLKVDYYIDKTKGLDYLLEILRLMYV